MHLIVFLRYIQIEFFGDPARTCTAADAVFGRERVLQFFFNCARSWSWSLFCFFIAPRAHTYARRNRICKNINIIYVPFFSWVNHYAGCPAFQFNEIWHLIFVGQFTPICWLTQNYLRMHTMWMELIDRYWSSNETGIVRFAIHCRKGDFWLNLS